jgi:hypothetical protein
VAQHTTAAEVGSPRGWQRSEAKDEFRLARRELSDLQVQEQAQHLAAFVDRGGNASRWFESKGFLAGDADAILLAWIEIREMAS